MDKYFIQKNHLYDSADTAPKSPKSLAVAKNPLL